MTSSPSSAIQADGLVKAYGTRNVVDGLNLRLGSGEIVGLLGPNGAGKTTAFYMIVGLVPVSAGTVSMDGRDITRLRMHERARHGIGYLPQEPSVFRKLTVEQNILAIVEAVGVPRGERAARVRFHLEELHLTPLAGQKAYTLSGGERRRLEIARSLVTEPKFFLMDEPFAAIDPISVAEVQKIILQLKARGIGVVVTDHNVRETLRIVDRAYLIHKGRMLAEGTGEFLIRDPQARKFYLGEDFDLLSTLADRMQKAIHGITVAHFYETYREKLRMELITGEAGLHRLIREGSINRPSLALTGFFKYFANKRIQVLGAAEMTFLKTRSAADQQATFREMVKRSVPCLVLTRNYHPSPVMLDVADKMKWPIFRTPLITMNFVNLATLCIDNEFAPHGVEHATTLDIKGVGVLLRGDSGVGKSECALALIERGHSLVADDLTVIKLRDERELMASSRPLNRGYMECRGIGIINIAEMFGVKSIRMEKRIDLVVTLREWTPEVVEERTGLEQQFYTILGMRVPHIELYVRPGRDMARLVEVAALTEALKRIGHPARDFNDRLIASMAKSDEPAPIQVKPIERHDPAAGE